MAAECSSTIAPDFLTGKAPGGGGLRELDKDSTRTLIRNLQEVEILTRLDTTAVYTAALPVAHSEFGIAGYCWGGGVSWCSNFNNYTGISPLHSSLANSPIPAV